MTTVPFAVLMVCTGNVCRSPAAERLLAARVPPSIIVRSAGLRALVGRGIDGPTALALRELGIDPSGHEARLVTPELIDEADVILAAESSQRSAILQSAPRAMRSTFTMREFARLGAALELPPRSAQPQPHALDEDALRRRVLEVAGQRGLVDPPGPGEDDIGDPFGAPVEVARGVVTAVEQAVAGIVAALGLGA